MSEDGGAQPAATVERAVGGAAQQNGAAEAACGLKPWENVLRIWWLPADTLEQQQQPEQQQIEMDGLEQEQQQEEDMGLEQGREEGWAEDAAALHEDGPVAA